MDLSSRSTNLKEPFPHAVKTRMQTGWHSCSSLQKETVGSESWALTAVDAHLLPVVAESADIMVFFWLAIDWAVN